MATGEGKTLVATLPCYLNALAGEGTVLVVTANDYLARRDAETMGQVNSLTCRRSDVRSRCGSRPFSRGTTPVLGNVPRNFADFTVKSHPYPEKRLASHVTS